MRPTARPKACWLLLALLAALQAEQKASCARLPDLEKERLPGWKVRLVLTPIYTY